MAELRNVVGLKRAKIEKKPHSFLFGIFYEQLLLQKIRNECSILTLNDCRNVHNKILRDLLLRNSFTSRAARNKRNMLGSKFIVPFG